MGDNIIHERASHLVSRLVGLDLREGPQRADAVDRVEKAFAGMVASGVWQDLLAMLDEYRLSIVTEESRGLLDRVEDLLRANAVTYVHPTLEDWWSTTAYQDEIGVDDAAFQNKPIHLKRIALEAFNVARRTRGLSQD